MNRTWTLRAAVPEKGLLLKGLVLTAEPVDFVATVSGVSVRAFDQTEAAEALLTALGLEPVPCCELGDEPCADCAEAAYDRAQEAREQGGNYPPRRETPEELRSQDADRGTLPDRTP